MKLFNTLFCLVLVSICFFSCQDDDNTPGGDFATGVFVINEGNFGSANGNVNHFNPETKTVTFDIFSAVNEGKALGDVVQSMTINGDKGYLVINNSNKVEVVNVNTFKSTGTITNLSLPRYFLVYKGKGYVTEWIDFTNEGRVSIINLSTNKVEKAIMCGYGPEGIIAVNNKLYVSNNFENTISVIDPVNEQVIQTIDVGSTPTGMTLDANNKLWVICQGGWGQNDASLYQINPETKEVIKSIPLNLSVSSTLLIDKNKTNLFFYSENVIYKVAVTADALPANPFISDESVSSFYGLGVDTNSEIIYAAEANFASNATITRYNADGSKIDTFEGGIGSNGFVFK